MRVALAAILEFATANIRDPFPGPRGDMGPGSKAGVTTTVAVADKGRTAKRMPAARRLATFLDLKKTAV